MSDSTSNSSTVSRGGLRNPTLALLVVYAAACAFFLTIKELPAATTVLVLQYAIPVLGVASLISGWGQSYLADTSRIGYLVKQILAWGGLYFLVQVLVLLGVTTGLGADKYALLLIALIGFTMLIAGINVDWKLFFVGAFIAAAFYLMAYPTNNPLAAWVSAQLNLTGDAKGTWVLVSLAVAGFLASFVVMWYMRSAIRSKRERR